MIWIDLEKEKPEKNEKYIVKTVTYMKNSYRFEPRFDGKNFDVSNQKVTHWLKEN